MSYISFTNEVSSTDVSSIQLGTEDNNVYIYTLPIQVFQTVVQPNVQQNCVLKTLPNGQIILEACSPNELTNQKNETIPNIISTNEINQNEKDNTNTLNKNRENLIVTDNMRLENGHIIQCETSTGIMPAPDKQIRKTTADNIICNECGEQFRSEIVKLKHQQSHHTEKPHKCGFCQRTFIHMTNLKLHLALHNPLETKCPECNKCFARVASLRAHLIVHEKDEHIACPECETLFESQVQLDLHMKIHELQKKNGDIHKCKSCDKSFSSGVDFKNHANEHYKLRRILKSFNRNVNSKKRKGKMTKNQLCRVCGKSFQKQSQLIRHQRIHSGERPFKCNVCNQSFSQTNTLKIHMAKHTKSRPHKCGLCPGTFSQRGNLRVHILRVHSFPKKGETMFSCDKCRCSFRKLSTLNAHINRVHAQAQVISPSKSIESGVEDVMNQLAELNKAFNTQINTLQVPVQANSILSTNDLLEEIDKSTEASFQLITLADTDANGVVRRYTIKQRKIGDVRWHQCTYCPKEFKKPSDVVRHIRIHTREKPFKCTICNRCFAVKSTLTTHLRTHTLNWTLNCNHCKKSFTCESTLQAHLRKNVCSKKTFKCDLCKKTYRTLEQMQFHKDRIHNRKSTVSEVFFQEPLIVDDNGQIQSSILKKDNSVLEVNSKPRPHKCKTCEAAFCKASHLEEHNKMHTDERPFQCQKCKSMFRTASILKCHMRTHDGVKPFVCIQCGSTFTTSSSLHRHMTKHSNKRPYMCPTCSKTFKTNANCRKHIKTHKTNSMLRDENLENNESIVSNENKLQENNAVNVVNNSDIEMIVTQNNTENLKALSTPMLTQHTVLEMDDELMNLIGEDGLTISSVDNVVSTIQIKSMSNNTTQTDQLKNVKVNEISTDPVSLVLQLNVKDNIKKIGENIENNNPKSTHEKQFEPSLQETNINNTSLEMLINQNNNENLETLSTTMLAQHTVLEMDEELMNLNTEEGLTISSVDMETSRLDNSVSIFDANLVTSNVTQTEKSENITNSAYPVALLLNVKNDEPVIVLKEDPSTLVKSRRKQNISKRNIDSEVIDNNAVESNKPKINAKKISEINTNKRIYGKGSKKVVKKYACKVCDKSFSKPSDMQRHVRIHTGERPFKCDVCEKCFTLSSTLKCHSKLHNVVKEMFTCHVCNKLFVSRGSLNVHQRLHTGVKPFQCPYCQLQFRTSGHKQSHVQMHLKEAKRLNCQPHEINTKQNQIQKLFNIVMNAPSTSVAEEPVVNKTNEEAQDTQVYCTFAENQQLDNIDLDPITTASYSIFGSEDQIETLTPNELMEHIQNGSILIENYGSVNNGQCWYDIQTDENGQIVNIHPSINTNLTQPEDKNITVDFLN